MPCPQKKSTSLCVKFLQWSKKLCPNNNKSCKLLIRFCKYRLLSEQWFARTPHHFIVSTTTRKISCHNYSLLPYLLGSSWGKKYNICKWVINVEIITNVVFYTQNIWYQYIRSIFHALFHLQKILGLASARGHINNDLQNSKQASCC